MNKREKRRPLRAEALLPEKRRPSRAGETSTDWLNLALEEPPFSEARRYCIKQAERLEAPKRGRGRPKGNGWGSLADYMALVDMEILAKRTGETKARKLARITLDQRIEAGYVRITTTQYTSVVERLAALWRRTGTKST